MPEFPFIGGASFAEDAGGASGDSGGTTITSSGTANTKGSYGQLIASTTRNAHYAIVHLNAFGNTVSALVDIAVGASSSEQIIMTNLLNSEGWGNRVVTYCFPVFIPGGSRLSARCQSTGTSADNDVSITLLSKAFRSSAPGGAITTYGAATGDSGGTQIDPGSTLNTEGAYTQISSSTTRRIRSLVVGIGWQARATAANVNWLIDIAVGAAASEQVIIPNLRIGSYNRGDAISPNSIGPIPVDIPSGSRLAVRAQADNAGSGTREFDLVLYGVE